MRFGLFLSAFTSKPLGPLAVAGRAAAAGSGLPGMLAKEASALAHLTGGRMVLGIGLGDRLGAWEHGVLELPYPPVAERTRAAEETALAVRALAAGGTWPGGDAVPAIAGPLLPAAPVEVWVGGTGPSAVRAAARAADGWNGWGMPDDAFVARAEQLAVETRDAGRDPAEVVPTWSAIALVGRDRTELATLEGARAESGGSLDIWRGTTDDLRRLRDRLDPLGVTWMIALAAGPPDRLDVIAETLRS